MASYATGVTVSFGGTTIGEVTELRVVEGGSLPLGRDSTFAVDVGTIEISSLATGSTAFISPTARGLKGTLSISGTSAAQGTPPAGGGSVTLTTKAILQTLDISAKVNDVWRFKNTFRIVKE